MPTTLSAPQAAGRTVAGGVKRGMKTRLFALGALLLLAVAGCSKSETPVVDPVAAKAQPGANTPAAASAGGAPTSQVRAEKEGK